MSKLIDLTGQQFGRLTVIRRVEDRLIGKTNRRALAWECKCSCGNTKIVLGEDLKRNKTKSCGCYNSELGSLKRKKNQFYQENDYIVGITSNGEKFYFDVEDLPKVENYCWRLSPYGYVITSAHKSEQYKIIYLHRLIMSCSDDCEVDHINHDKVDNRKLNLRTCTRCENSWNRGTLEANTSGHRGVYFDKQIQKWFARITVNTNVITLGYYNRFEDAVTARLSAEAKYFKEFAYNPDIKKLSETEENNA